MITAVLGIIWVSIILILPTTTTILAAQPMSTGTEGPCITAVTEQVNCNIHSYLYLTGKIFRSLAYDSLSRLKYFP